MYNANKSIQTQTEHEIWNKYETGQEHPQGLENIRTYRFLLK